MPIDAISIGANHRDERARSFNGSIAIVRVYDKALTAAEVLDNIRWTVVLSVDPAEHLAATWGSIKLERSLP